MSLASDKKDAQPREVLTPQEVADALRWPVRKIWRWCREGRLRYLRPAGTHEIRFYRDELDEDLRRHEIAREANVIDFQRRRRGV
ncbi:MAG TPA: helix-turn-helix domain-containing protein [Blastocatellia bacterium]|nr:helix-turn-helix domain-containing protein [Blastocatellia bacterium]